MVTLKCERIHLPPLPPHVFAARLDGFVADYADVARHVLVDRGEWYPPWSNPNNGRRSSACTARRELPPLDIVATVLSWVLFSLNWHERYRRLTDTECALRDAAWRLSDSLHGPRGH